MSTAARSRAGHQTGTPRRQLRSLTTCCEGCRHRRRGEASGTSFARYHGTDSGSFTHHRYPSLTAVFTHNPGTHLDDPRRKQRLCSPARVAVRRAPSPLLSINIRADIYLFSAQRLGASCVGIPTRQYSCSCKLRLPNCVQTYGGSECVMSAYTYIAIRSSCTAVLHCTAACRHTDTHTDARRHLAVDLLRWCCKLYRPTMGPLAEAPQTRSDQGSRTTVARPQTRRKQRPPPAQM